SRAKHHCMPFTIHEAKQDRAIAFNARWTSIHWTLIPDLLWLNDRHGNLLSACEIHLRAYNTRDILEHAIAERQKAINARGQLTNKTCAHQEFCVAAFGITWSFTQRCC